MVTYHLFQGLYYYPSDGLGDYIGPYNEDLDKVVARGEAMTNSETDAHYDWFVVVAKDTDTDELVEVYRSGVGRLNERANLA